MLILGQYLVISRENESLSAVQAEIYFIQISMSLENYFKNLIEKVEASETITNQGKDAEGFYKPTRTILLRHLNILKDLHMKPLAKPMLKSSWKFVVEHTPPEWLIVEEPEKSALKAILK